jgi:DNA-binding NtrC family response regulator
MKGILKKNIIGKSALIEKVRKIIKLNAQYSAPVLITGETGTGKELAARGLHYSGIFVNKPFIAINCSTFSDDLFASELFGYKKGAFTDAKSDKEGLITSAKGGSIFLDEIDSLSLKSQAALLRLLQEAEYRPVGSSQILKSNVRIITAANCNLQERIKSGEFRQDLYFRLLILSVKMPALREVKEDLPLLINHFISKFNTEYGLNRTGFCQSLLNKLQQHNWPGNIRELENTIHRYYLLADSEIINDRTEIDCQIDDFTYESLPTLQGDENSLIVDEYSKEEETSSEQSDVSASQSFDFSDAKRKAVEAFESRFVSQLLSQAKGNVTKAADMCGKERRSFGKLVKKYNICRESMRE